MKVLIVEDEARMAKRLHNIVNTFFKKSLVKCHCLDNIDDANTYLSNNTIDLLLLDLNLNGESGFNILTMAISQSFFTIIVSGNRDQALTAFEYGVLDFVPKPYSRERINLALKRVISKDKNPEGTLKYLAVKSKTIKLIAISEILYIKGAGTYTELFLKNGQIELHDKSLESLSKLLPNAFQRTHKSYLVKTAEIKEILVSSGSKYQLVLKNEELLPVGRTKYKQLKESLFK